MHLNYIIENVYIPTYLYVLLFVPGVAGQLPPDWTPNSPLATVLNIYFYPSVHLYNEHIHTYTYT